MRRTIATLGTFAVLLTAVACGGGSGDEPDSPAMKPYLISLSDLPTGWSTYKGDEGQDPPDCLERGEKTMEQGAESAEASFKASPSGPWISSGVGRWDTVDEASATLQDALAAYTECDRFSYGVGSSSYDGTLSQLSFPSVGEESWAIEVVLRHTEARVAFDVYVITARVGDMAVVMSYMSTSPDPDAAKRLVDLALSKLPQSGSGSSFGTAPSEVEGSPFDTTTPSQPTPSFKMPRFTGTPEAPENTVEVPDYLQDPALLQHCDDPSWFETNRYTFDEMALICDY